MAALFKAISSSIKACQGPLIFTPHWHFCGLGKDYKLIVDRQLVQKKPAEGRDTAKSQKGPHLSQGQWSSRQQLGRLGDGLRQHACFLGEMPQGETEGLSPKSYSSCFLMLPICFQLRVGQPTPSVASDPILTPHSLTEVWTEQFQRKEVINHKPFLSVSLWMDVSCACMCACVCVHACVF